MEMSIIMKKDSLTIRQTKALETKSKIYTSAENLFRKYGFESVSVNSIVEEAGVSKGSFYVHFESKNALITSLMADYVNALDLNYKSYLESFPPDTPASDILISLVGKIADIMTDYLGYDILRVAYEALLTRTVNTDSIIGYNRDLYRIFSAVIDRGVRKGEFQAYKKTDIISKHCVLAIRGLTYEWCIRHPDFNLKEEMINHFEIILMGIRKP